MKRILLLISASVALLFSLSWGQGEVKIEWFGHSCFRLTLSDGYRIVLDPFNPAEMGYAYPDGAECCFSTHDHYDHNHWQKLNPPFYALADGRKNEFKVREKGVESRKSGPLSLDKGKVTCYTVPSFHDDSQGSKRGVNGIICLQADGLRMVHLGDLGVKLDQKQIEAIGKVDILLVPVGGKYTIDPQTATTVCKQLNPKIILPMHYQTDRLEPGFGLAGVDRFVKLWSKVQRVNDYQMKVSLTGLPKQTEVVILKYHP